jgi:hypothetical protein
VTRLELKVLCNLTLQFSSGEGWEAGREKLRLFPDLLGEWNEVVRSLGFLQRREPMAEVSAARSAPPPASPGQMGKGAAFPYQRWVRASVIRLGIIKGLWR